MASDTDTQAAYGTKDPLGVIQKAAKQIWKDRGAPAGTTWQDFIAEAEELLLAGRSTLPDRTEPEELPLSTPEILPPEVWAMRDQDYNPFGAAIAWGTSSLFNEHEAFCLATLLGANEFKLAGGEYRRCSKEEIEELLAALAGEYDENFVKREGEGSLSAISNEKRCEYWRNKLSQWRNEDRPLNYHDRNTIDRLKDAVMKHPLVEGCRFLNEGK